MNLKMSTDEYKNEYKIPHTVSSEGSATKPSHRQSLKFEFKFQVNFFKF